MSKDKKKAHRILVTLKEEDFQIVKAACDDLRISFSTFSKMAVCEFLRRWGYVEDHKKIKEEKKAKK